MDVGLFPEVAGGPASPRVSSPGGAEGAGAVDAAWWVAQLRGMSGAKPGCRWVGLVHILGEADGASDTDPQHTV